MTGIDTGDHGLPYVTMAVPWLTVDARGIDMGDHE